jgi:cell division protease FtsH
MPPFHEREYAEKTAAAVDEEVRTLIDRMLQRARELLERRRDLLDRSARQLLEKETLDESELIKLLGPPAGAPLRTAAE